MQPCSISKARRRLARIGLVLAISAGLGVWAWAAQLVSDNFNRADGSLGANYTTAATTSAPAIAGNVVTGGGGDSVAVWTQVGAWTNPTDYYSEITATAIGAGDNGGPVVRFATASETGYQFNVVGALGTSQTHTVYRIDSGTYTPMPNGAGSTGPGTFTGTINANDVLRLEVSGTGATVTLVAKVNGVARITCTDTSASRIATASKPGFLVSGVTGTTFDNWAAGDLLAGSVVPRNFLLLGLGQ